MDKRITSSPTLGEKDLDFQPTASSDALRRVLIACIIGLVAIAVSLQLRSLGQRRPQLPPSTIAPVQMSGSTNLAQVSNAPSSAELGPLNALDPPMVRDGVMWVFDYHGRLLVSRDSGVSWTPLAGNVPAQFAAVTMLDGQHGWAADDEGKIWRSDDAGNNWNPIGHIKSQHPDDRYYGAEQIVFTDNNHGWLVDLFNVWRTSDGGYSWAEVNDLNRSKGPVRRIVMVNSRIGWAICTGDLLTTDDGGNNWRSVRRTTLLDQYASINALSAVDEHRACLAATDAPKPYPENVVLCTENGGVRWYQASGIDERYAIYSMFSFDSLHSWAVGGDDEKFRGYLGQGVVYRTEDGGKTWLLVAAAPTVDSLRAVGFTSQTDGWLASNYTVYHTSNSGQSWSEVLSYPEVKKRNHQNYYGSAEDINMVTQK